MALLAVTVAPGVVCATTPVSPAADSDVVLRLRAEPQGELRLEYRKEIPGESPETVRFAIAADYYYVQDAKALRLYDYRLRRILQLRAGQVFVNDSLFADVWFRFAELRNRVMLAHVLKSAGISAPQAAGTTDPFWVETELGAISAEFPRPQLRRVDDKTRVRWLKGTEEVAAVRFAAQTVPEGVRGDWRRFWGTVVHVHPAIADELAADKRVPQELWIEGMKFGKPATVTHWTRLSSQWEAAAAFPLPAHLPAQPTRAGGVFPEIFATLAATIAGKKVPPPEDVYVSRAEAAIQRGAGLEALLWILERDLAAGKQETPCQQNDTRPGCALLVRAGTLAKTDPRTAIAFNKQSPDAADRPQFDSLPNDYLLKLLWATRPPGKGIVRANTEQDLLKALRASPVANFCKDTGDFYAGGWESFAAWQAWDLGRLMANHTPGDLLASIDTLEASLVREEPDFF